MKTELTPGLKFTSVTTDGYFTINKVTDKIVTYFKSNGATYMANVNTIRIFRVSLKRAIKYFDKNHWSILN